jgi:hypothetical protein
VDDSRDSLVGNPQQPEADKSAKSGDGFALVEQSVRDQSHVAVTRREFDDAIGPRPRGLPPSTRRLSAAICRKPNGEGHEETEQRHPPAAMSIFCNHFVVAPW